ncbi:hypothetical protein JZU56_04295, partial [bacterium]|nr:hypothetical protein [bacterium]
ESRASALSTERLPGEPVFTPLSSLPTRRSFIHAALQPTTSERILKMRPSVAGNAAAEAGFSRGT